MSEHQSVPDQEAPSQDATKLPSGGGGGRGAQTDAGPGRPPASRPTLDEVRGARERITGAARRTPLLELEHDAPDGPELYLKLECLQPIGSFKIRGAGNAMALADPSRIRRGVYTGSAGNMAQGVAWNARRLGVPCRVIVPDSAPRAKLDAIARLSAVTVPLPFPEWWSVLLQHGHPDEDGLFVHPVSDPGVIAGNGTIGLEILEDLPDVDAVVVPFGGGGLSCGIASTVKALRPGVRVCAAEVDTAAPFAASLDAGRLVDLHRQPSFVDGIGGGGMLPEMWPLAREVLDDSIVVGLGQIAQAIRVLASRARVVAEGAGAASVAAALTGAAGNGKVVAVVSGGNIDLEVLSVILAGGMP